MIDLRDIQFHYPTGGFSLGIRDLHIETGSAVAMVGPSGTGKTTLLNLMAGIHLPHGGSISIGGTDLLVMTDAARRNYRIRHIGLVFQEFELLSYLSVLDNLLLPYRISPSLELTPAVRERAAILATEVGLGDKLRRKVNHLSQGERQRAAVCRSLLPEPSLLLCDEPTGNLDPENKQIVLDLLFSYVRKNGATLVVVTHDHDLLPLFDHAIDPQGGRHD